MAIYFRELGKSALAGPNEAAHRLSSVNMATKRNKKEDWSSGP